MYHFCCFAFPEPQAVIGVEINSKQLEVPPYTYIHNVPSNLVHFVSKPKQVCVLRIVLNGTEAEFSSRVDEFESLIGDSLYTAVENNIMLYYNSMVADIQKGAEGTIR